MFPVDLLHKLLRHSVAHHRRETIAFTRRLNAAMERLCLTVIWRNFVKARSERKPRSPTPAVLLGITDTPWKWKRVFMETIVLRSSDAARTVGPALPKGLDHTSAPVQRPPQAHP
jgi:hypothetical protein